MHTPPSRGRSGSRWRKLREQIKASRPPCYLCGQPINYQAPYPADDSFTVEHIKSWINHPELREDPANLVAAHAKCNKAKGAGEIKHELGNTLEQW